MSETGNSNFDLQWAMVDEMRVLAQRMRVQREQIAKSIASHPPSRKRLRDLRVFAFDIAFGATHGHHGARWLDYQFRRSIGEVAEQ